jgi:predicted dehydrogenase
MRRAVELMRSEEFGTPVFAESMYFTPGPGFGGGESRPGWRYMIYQATHPIDLAHHVLGDIARVFATCGVGANQMPAYAVAVQFARGASGFLNLNGAAPHWTSRLDIVSDRFAQLTVTDLVSLEYQRQTEGGYSFPTGRPSQRWDIPLRDNAERRAGYLGEMEHFAECVLHSTPPYPSARDGCRALQVCAAILDSVETGQPVEVRYE